MHQEATLMALECIAYAFTCTFERLIDLNDKFAPAFCRPRKHAMHKSHHFNGNPYSTFSLKSEGDINNST